LAGLVGLGGGEFRLPVLMYVVGYSARTAVPLNLAVSLITLTFALVVRSTAVSVGALMPYLNEVVGLAVGGVASASYGARFVSGIKSEHLIKTIAALLAALGVLILFEVAYPFQYAQVIPAAAVFHFGAGFALGLIDDERVPKDMLDLAIHIVDSKRGEFDPEKFADHYENALKELLRKKQKGEKIERPKEPARTNVVNLMDALRESVQAAGRKRSNATRAQKKKGKKRIEGQREMLLPIPGKKDKEAVTKSTARSSGRHRKAG
jgi:hypothetical protein